MEKLSGIIKICIASSVRIAGRRYFPIRNMFKQMKIKTQQIRFVGIDFNHLFDPDHYLKNNTLVSVK